MPGPVEHIANRLAVLLFRRLPSGIVCARGPSPFAAQLADDQRLDLSARRAHDLRRCPPARFQRSVDPGWHAHRPSVAQLLAAAPSLGSARSPAADSSRPGRGRSPGGRGHGHQSTPLALGLGDRDRGFLPLRRSTHRSRHSAGPPLFPFLAPGGSAGRCTKEGRRFAAATALARSGDDPFSVGSGSASTLDRRTGRTDRLAPLGSADDRRFASGPEQRSGGPADPPSSNPLRGRLSWPARLATGRQPPLDSLAIDRPAGRSSSVQFDAARGHDVAMFVDLWLPTGAAVDGLDTAGQSVETALSLTATLVSDICRQRGLPAVLAGRRRGIDSPRGAGVGRHGPSGFGAFGRCPAAQAVRVCRSKFVDGPGRRLRSVDDRAGLDACRRSGRAVGRSRISAWLGHVARIQSIAVGRPELANYFSLV